MLYIIYVLLLIVSLATYFIVTWLYGNKVKEAIEHLEYKYITEHDEEVKKELYQELSNMETRAYKKNALIRWLLVIFPTLATILLIVLMIQPVIDIVEFFKANICEFGWWFKIKMSIGIIVGVALNIYIPHELMNIWEEGMYYHRKKKYVNGCGYTEQQQLACVYPERFPLSRVNHMAAYNLYKNYKYNKYKKEAAQYDQWKESLSEYKKQDNSEFIKNFENR